MSGTIKVMEGNYIWYRRRFSSQKGLRQFMREFEKLEKVQSGIWELSIIIE